MFGVARDGGVIAAIEYVLESEPAAAGYAPEPIL